MDIIQNTDIKDLKSLTLEDIPNDTLNKNKSNVDWRVMHLILRMRKRVQRYCSLRIVGTSMKPTMRDGDIVTLDLQFNHIVPGDIVVFPGNHGYGLIIHRVLWKKGNNYWIKGDNALRIDVVHKKDILAVTCKNALRDKCNLIKYGKFIYYIALIKSVLVAFCAFFLRKLNKRGIDISLAWYINKLYQNWLNILIYGKKSN